MHLTKVFMKNRILTPTALSAALLAFAFNHDGVAAQSGAEKAKPNILILYVDDWRNGVKGVAGHPIVKTPEMDQLAGQGVRFTNSYVTTSICGVSRASLYTGQWMSRHGCRGFSMWDTPWSESFPAILRENGYYLGLVGKWHNRPFPKEEFDFGRVYHGLHWYRLDRRDEHMVHVTQRNENDALDFLRERPKDQPFCLTVSFGAPHAEDQHPLQFLPQPESMSLYQGVEVPVSPNATHEDWERLPYFFDENNEGRNRWRWRFDTPDKYQFMMKNYFRLITEIDTTSGRILRKLEEQGALENTLVILTSDNGFYHAEHGLADKWYPHEESIRVPLIIKDPRMCPSQHGTTRESMVLNVDLAPTILNAAGLEVPAGVQGQDLAPLYLAEEKPEWRDEFFYEHPTLRDASFIPASEALVRTDWKYFYWPEHGVEQLFHLETDPYEQNDLAADEAYQDKLKAMRTRFNELKAAAK